MSGIEALLFTSNKNVKGTEEHDFEKQFFMHFRMWAVRRGLASSRRPSQRMIILRCAKKIIFWVANRLHLLISSILLSAYC